MMKHTYSLSAFTHSDSKNGEPIEGAKLYVYAWNRMERKGELCQVLVRGKMNSCLVRFVRDGFVAVTSRNALRKSGAR